MDILAASVWLRYLEACGEKIPFPANAYRGDYVRPVAEKLRTLQGETLRRPSAEVLKGLPADEPDGGEHENPEGFGVRVRTEGRRNSRAFASARRGASGARFVGRSHRTDSLPSQNRPEIRSGSVTGSRQRAHLPR